MTNKIKLTYLDLTRAEMEALLFAATEAQGIENTGVVAGNEATAKLRKALEK